MIRNTTKIVKAYITYDLDTWPNKSLRNYTLKSCLFNATSIVKNSDKEYSDYVIAFDRKGTWSFGHDYARNVVIFNVDNSSLSHSDNRKNNFFV